MARIVAVGHENWRREESTAHREGQEPQESAYAGDVLAMPIADERGEARIGPDEHAPDTPFGHGQSVHIVHALSDKLIIAGMTVGVSTVLGFGGLVAIYALKSITGIDLIQETHLGELF